MGDIVERCPTGIEGFDKLCQGGFVRNSDNLILGGPGSGKSTFLLQFLWNGVTKFGENGLYCSFEPDIVETLKDGMMMGWDFTKLSNDDRIKFMRFAPQTSIDELKAELTRMISKYDIKRICFDPISVLAMNLSDEGKIRQVIFDLSSLLKRLKVTAVFADESLEGEIGLVEREWTKTDILRFLSDSVTIFYESGIAGVGDRALRIVKMRRTSHERMAIGMKILPTGIEVIDPSLLIGDLPPIDEVDSESEEIEEDNEIEDSDSQDSESNEETKLPELNPALIPPVKTIAPPLQPAIQKPVKVKPISQPVITPTPEAKVQNSVKSEVVDDNGEIPEEVMNKLTN
jgi:KaiC/GvpD/RAD55 family RecA-like ATPase